MPASPLFVGFYESVDLEMELYEADMLVFGDQRGADRRDSLRKLGYSLRGKCTQAHKLIGRGHVSAICAISL